MKRIIITADDYGMTKEVNRGIATCVMKEAITSVSVMANGDLSGIKRILTSNITTGVHLNLTHGKPVSPSFPVTLLESGIFQKYFRRDGHIQYHIDDDDVEREFERQIEIVGNNVTTLHYLDCHHHLHELDKVFQIISKLAKKYSLAIRAVNRSMASRLRALGIKCPDTSILSFFGNDATETVLKKAISETVGDVVEVVSHPGFVSKEIDDDYNEGRLQDMTVITKPSVLSWLRENYDLVSYNTLFADSIQQANYE